MAGRHAEALPHLVWLWTHSLEIEPAWVGVRYSYLLGVLKEVSGAHAPAREELDR